MGHPSFTGVCFWAYSGGLGFALVRAKCRGGSAAWVARVLAAPGTQSWQLGQQSSKRVWQPVLANVLQYSYLENPNREAYQATVYRVAKSWICMKWSCLHRCKTFFFWPVAALPQWELSVKVAQLAGTLAAPSMWRHGLPPLQEVWPSQSLFQASCSWCSEGLFGQPLSVALPTQALRGSPCLQSVSVVGHVRHTEGWGGVLLCSSVTQAFDGPASLLFSCRGWYVRKQRGYGDGFAFMAARVFSTGISHHNLLVHIP